jgi:S-formylglutathione hydrolase FrmB
MNTEKHLKHCICAWCEIERQNAQLTKQAKLEKEYANANRNYQVAVARMDDHSIVYWAAQMRQISKRIAKPDAQFARV